MNRRTIAAALLSASLLVPALAGAATPRAGVDYVPGEVLVLFRPGASAAAMQSSFALQGHSLIDAVGDTGWQRVRPAPGQTVMEAVAAWAADPSVEMAQPNFIYRASAVPDDPGFPQVWGLRNTAQTITTDRTQPPGTPLAYPISNPGTAGDDMNLVRAWDQITDCSSVVVAVLDTGINYNHEDLAQNMWTTPDFPLHGRNVVDRNDDPMDRNGHGTHVAGTIGARGNNGVGIAGVCWRVQLMAVRVLDTTGSGTTVQIIQGMDFASTHGAKVINMSLGGTGGSDPAYSLAIDRAQAADVAVVVAAGNSTLDNDITPTWPCNFPQANVYCVAALDQSYNLASFSNWGLTTVAVGAPGTNVVSTWPGTNAEIGDPLTDGWTIPNGGWAYWTSPTARQYLVNPSGFPDALYTAGATQSAYKGFAIPAADVTTLFFRASIDVANGDNFLVNYRAGGSTLDPFAGGTNLGTATGTFTYPATLPLEFDVSNCASQTCTVGFQLASTGGSARGFAIRSLVFTTLSYNATSYNTLNGTSMATPMVSGVVALLRAYNPRFTYADALNAIGASGRPIPALDGKTRTGRAVDAMAALAWVQAPTGLSATVQ